MKWFFLFIGLLFGAFSGYFLANKKQSEIGFANAISK